jgi:hypothetical protein
VLSSHGQVQDLTSPVGIVPNMFADVTQSSTLLASSPSRLFSSAGEFWLLE